jgi:5-methylcytosine-specific restriction protein B
MLDSRIDEGIHSEYESLSLSGEILSEDQLNQCYSIFRARFGPEVLASLQGTELLEKMHGRGGNDSLVYWLEFKNDEEFPGTRFGSIAGGSALKFEIYRSTKSGHWMTGSPQDQRAIPPQEAMSIASRQRDELLRAIEVIAAHAQSGKSDYGNLQEQLAAVAPSVEDSSWGHKYLHMIFPEHLDDFHVEAYQRFHIIKLLQTPPFASGRYANAGVYVAACRETGLRMNHLTSLLNSRHGRPYQYWRVGTRPRGENSQSEWRTMISGGFAGVGWGELGDLSDIPTTRAGKQQLTDRFEQVFPSQSSPRQISQLFRFLTGPKEGHIILAADGERIFGVGRVTGDYQFVGDQSFAHQVPVQWLSVGEWQLPHSEGVRTTVSELANPENLVTIEQQILDPTIAPDLGPSPPPATLPALTGPVGRIDGALKRKGQVVLYGPPGTGKTHWALIAAREICSRSWFGRPYSQLSEGEKRQLESAGAIETCTFHPSYGYEDFLEGYRPRTVEEGLTYELVDGIFRTVCRRAEAQPSKSFVLIVDEINRGDVPRIMGELLTVLEMNKRGQAVTLPLSRARFSVPENVLLIGTMNTADRSIALLDTALRRRFAFIELMPDSSVLADASIAGLPLGPWLDALNERIRRYVGRDARNLQIGHAYLMTNGRALTEPRRLVNAVRDEIIPLLQEYCYEDYDALAHILGTDLVDRESQTIADGLFATGTNEAIIQALLQASPEIIATEASVAVSAGEDVDIAFVGEDDDTPEDE